MFAVDSQESDLGILDLIQVFVESLDKCFENVCELGKSTGDKRQVRKVITTRGFSQSITISNFFLLLDLIFHSDRVHYVLDEIVMGGMVLETNISSILQSIKDQGKMHQDSLNRADASEPSSSIRERLGGELSTWQYNW